MLGNRVSRFLVIVLFAGILQTAAPLQIAQAAGPGSVEFLDQYDQVANQGTGLITSLNAVTPSGLNDFTHEMWIKPTVTNLGEAVLFTTGTNRFTLASTTEGNCNSLTLLIIGGKVGYTFGHWKTNTVAALTGTLLNGVYMSSNVLTAEWHHIALTQTSNVIKLWVDGVNVASSGNITVNRNCESSPRSASYSTTAINFSNIALNFGEWYVGRISNYRYTLSEALYTTTFTPPTTAPTSTSVNQWVAPFDYTLNGTYEIINNGVVATPFTVAVDGTGPTGNGKTVAGSVVSREFTPFAKFTPTFTWPTVSKNVGDSSFTLAAPTPSTTGTFTYSSATTSVISLSGTTATVGSAGTSVITATFTPTNTVDYNSTTTTMTITVVGSGQTITFGALSDKIISDTPPSLSATSTSGLTVAFTSATTGVCTVSGTSITFVGPGTCTINANQAGNGTYAAALQIQQSFGVSYASQTVTFGALADKIISDTPPTLSATATSGLTVAFTSATTGVCTVSGTTVILVAPGTCTINANQAGNGTYAAAPQVQRSFAIAYLTQTISFDALAGATLGVSSAPLIRGSASSGLGVTFSSTTPGVCSVSGTTISMLNPGTCTISASQAGNGTYTAAASVSQSFSITAKPDDGQKELMEILTLLPGLASISKNIGDLAINNMTKCVKGKLVKRVKLGAKCPKGYVKRK